MERNDKYKLSEQEEKIIEFVRGINCGEIRIVINDGKPIRIEEIRKSLIL